MPRRTTNQGVPVRFFRVRYTKAQKAEHFRAFDDFMRNGVYAETFSAGPLDEDDGPEYEGGGLEACFLISEKFADAYVERIAAVK